MSGMQLYQLKDYISRTKIGSSSSEALDNLFDLLFDKFDKPLDIDLSGAVLTIEAATKQKLESDGAGGKQNAYKWRLPPIAGQNIDPVESTLNFSTGAVTADITLENVPTMTSGYYIQMGIELREDGKFYTVWGDEAASAGATTFPRYNDDASGIIWVTLRDDGTGGQWHYVVPVKSEIYVMGSVGGGGGGGGDSSFKLNDVAGSTASFKKGKWTLPGLTLISGNVTADAPVNFDIDLSSILTTPAATTKYWLCIDLDKKGDPVILSDTKQVAYPIYQASQFVLIPADQGEIDESRYVMTGTVYTPGAAWSSVVSKTRAPRLHVPLSTYFPYAEKITENHNSATTKTITHAFGEKPDFIVLKFWDNSAGEFKPQDITNFITDITDVDVDFNFASKTFDAGDYMEIILIYIPHVGRNLASSAYQFQSEWFTDALTAQVPHTLRNMDSIKGMALIEWDVTNGKRKWKSPDEVVKNWDDTNIYLDWSSVVPTSTLRYKLVTGNTSLPSADPSVKRNRFEFTGTGQLTSSTTSYPTDIRDASQIVDFVAIQEVSSGVFKTIDIFGKVSLENVAGVYYLRGNIDGDSPSPTNPITITVTPARVTEIPYRAASLSTPGMLTLRQLGYTKFIGSGYFASLTAANPQSGDSVLILEDYTITSQEEISSSNVKIRKLPGVKISTNFAAPGTALLVSGSKVDVDIEIEHQASMTNGIQVTGDDNFVKGHQSLVGVITLASGVTTNSGADRNSVDMSINKGSGTLTAGWTDNGTDNSGNVRG